MTDPLYAHPRSRWSGINRERRMVDEAMAAIPDIVRAIQRMDTPEFRRKFYEGNMADIEDGFDWFKSSPQGDGAGE